MKKLIPIIITGILLLTAGFIQAQPYGENDNGDGARLLSAIEKTDQVIAKAKLAVQESGSKRALKTLQAAVTLQAVSKRLKREAFDQVSVQMGVRAGKKTFEARTKAERAIAITRQAGENEDYVRQRLEKTQEKINRIEGRFDGAIPDQTMQLIDTAKDKLQRAVEFFRNGRLKAALQITLQIQKSLEKLAQNMGNFANLQKQYQNSLERYFSLEERILGSNIAGESEVQNRLKMAQTAKDEAQGAYESERYRMAEKKIRRAVEVLYRLAEKMRDPARIKNEINNLKREAEKIYSQISNDDTRLMNIYRNAEDHLTKAQKLYRGENYDAAAVQLQAMRQLLRQIRNHLGE